MGILEIFYNEFNRIRDKKEQKEKSKEGIHNLLKKLLKRFIIDWEQFSQLVHKNFYDKTYSFYDIYREDFLSIFVEIDEFLKPEFSEKLKELCFVLEEGKNTFASIGRESYENRKDAGKRAKQIAEELIKKL